jgi:hypothetical protein
LVLLLILISGVLGSRGRSPDGRDEGRTMAPCPAPKLDVKSWLSVDQKRFTFSLPPDFREVKVLGIDSWVREFQSADSSVSLSFDWGGYSDPLTKPTYGVTTCVERIGERQARLVAFSLPNQYYGDGEGGAKYGAGAAWRDVKPGVHLTMIGWARERRGLDQLLRISRTVRFEETD